MQPFLNVDEAERLVKKGKPVEMEVTDENGSLLTPEELTASNLRRLVRARNLKNEEATRAAERAARKAEKQAEQGVVIANAFDGVSWVDKAGNARQMAVYDTPEQLIVAIAGWEQAVVERIKSGDNYIPDAEGLFSHLGVSPGVVKGWRRGERGVEMQNVIEVELNRIAAVKNQLAMRGIIPPLVWVTQMNNVHGYTQTKNMEIEVSAKRTPESAESLIKSAKLLP